MSRRTIQNANRLCSHCLTQVVGLERNKGGPVAFCSDACQREHYVQVVARKVGEHRINKQTASYYARLIAAPQPRACPACGEAKTNLRVYHKDGDWKNNDPDNLYWQCPGCHRRDWWKRRKSRL